MPFVCSITAAIMHNPHKAHQKDTQHTERHMNQAVVRAPNSTQQHEKQQHTLAAHRKTQEEQALTICKARRQAKSISSTHMQRAQNIMHFAIQPCLITIPSSPQLLYCITIKINHTTYVQVRLDGRCLCLCRKGYAKCHKRKTNFGFENVLTCFYFLCDL
jgi:hypothetical protein